MIGHQLGTFKTSNLNTRREFCRLVSVIISQKVTEVLKPEHVVDACRSQSMINHQLGTVRIANFQHLNGLEINQQDTASLAREAAQ